MMASSGNILRKSTLLLNAAILALTLNATSLAFSDPIPVGAATGQVTVISDSSANVADEAGLTKKAKATVSVKVTPATESVLTGATQQFEATVTGSTDKVVSWEVSGSGCSGSRCGEISSSGLYKAPTSVPSPDSITITATSATKPTKSASAHVKIVAPVTHATYYLAPSGNDLNSGLSPAAPWLTPDHAVNCGDVILAAAGNYPPFTTFGTVTCPTANNVAWLKCATFDTCKIVTDTGLPFTQGMVIGTSYWGVQGWEVTALSGGSGACYEVRPTGASNIHHIILANDIANGCSQGGFDAAANVEDGTGVDYFVVVGSIAYNAAQASSTCTSGINAGLGAVAHDSSSGTHYYWGGNFAYGNVEPNPCNGGIPTDGEGLFIDKPGHYSQQMVIDNNIAIFNGGAGVQAYDDNVGSSNAKIYFRHNTTYGNQTGRINSVRACSEIYIGSSNSIQIYDNLAVTSDSTACYTEAPLYVFSVTGVNSTDRIYSNYGYSAAGYNAMSFGVPFTFGPGNIFENPGFADPVDPGPPSCGGSASVPNCMAKVIANFTPR